MRTLTRLTSLILLLVLLLFGIIGFVVFCSGHTKTNTSIVDNNEFGYILIANNSNINIDTIVVEYKGYILKISGIKPGESKIEKQAVPLSGLFDMQIHINFSNSRSYVNTFEWSRGNNKDMQISVVNETKLAFK